MIQNINLLVYNRDTKNFEQGWMDFNSQFQPLSWCKNSPLVQKFASGTSERLKLSDYLPYSRCGDIPPIVKITPQPLQEQIWLDRFTRPERRAEDGFWRVISDVI